MLGQFGQLLRAIAGLPDPSGIPTPGEVIPTIEIGHPTADWLYPRGTYLYAGYHVLAGVAANRSIVSLNNPTGSGVLCVLERIQAVSPDSVLVLTTGGTPLTSASGTYRARDVRLWLGTYSNRQPACRVRYQARSFFGDSLVRIQPDATDGALYYFHHHIEYVLLPGSNLFVNTGNDNQNLTCSMWWRERLFEPEELAGCDARIFV